MKAREQQKHLFTGRWRSVPIVVPKEVELQFQLVTMLKWCLKPTVIWFHCPNGELRDKNAAAKLRAMGVLPGVSDLMFFWRPVNSFRALFLELKAGRGKLSTEQAAFGFAVSTMGAGFEVASSVDEAIAAV